jgi:hypothetical protein
MGGGARIFKSPAGYPIVGLPILIGNNYCVFPRNSGCFFLKFYAGINSCSFKESLVKSGGSDAEE